MPITKKKRKAVATKKKVVAKKVTAKKTMPAKAAKKIIAPLPVARPKKHTIYIESSAFGALNSADGYIDNFQDGRHTATPNRSLVTPIVLPVGAVIKSMSIHYMNTTSSNVMAVFLRKHADRHSPSGEIEMSFITLPNSTLPPDNYLTVTDTTFPVGGVVEDRFLHYLEVNGTGNFGADGKITVRGVSISYVY
jgi:hypothetical protein